MSTYLILKSLLRTCLTVLFLQMCTPFINWQTIEVSFTNRPAAKVVSHRKSFSVGVEYDCQSIGNNDHGR